MGRRNVVITEVVKVDGLTVIHDSSHPGLEMSASYGGTPVTSRTFRALAAATEAWEEEQLKIKLRR